MVRTFFCIYLVVLLGVTAAALSTQPIVYPARKVDVVYHGNHASYIAPARKIYTTGQQALMGTVFSGWLFLLQGLIVIVVVGTAHRYEQA